MAVDRWLQQQGEKADRKRASLMAVHSKAKFDIRNLKSSFAAFEMATTFGQLGNLSSSDVQQLLPAMRRRIVITIENRMTLAVLNGILQPPHEYNLFGGLIRQLVERGESISIVTFNYDIGVDFGLRAHRLALDYCFEDAPSRDGGTIELMKLHGSIN